MKKAVSLYCLATLLTILWTVSTTAQTIETYFSPRGGCAAACCREIDKAKTSLLIQAYSISEPNITAAILRASTKGVQIRIIVDRHQQNDQYSSAPKLKAAGVRIVCDRVEALQHNKVMIIDADSVITGSFNFTAAAENKNAENLIVIHDTAIAKTFTDDWLKHQAHSSVYEVIHHNDFKPKKLPPGLITPLSPRPRKEPH
jgi:phosphatidylserine/phosphatidylglycerophosphate/cardiolipin synthase-like enzyme